MSVGFDHRVGCAATATDCPAGTCTGGAQSMALLAVSLAALASHAAS